LNNSLLIEFISRVELQFSAARKAEHWKTFQAEQHAALGKVLFPAGEVDLKFHLPLKL
jgi:hypothetical protein